MTTFSFLDTDVQIILSLVGTWFVDPNSTYKTGKKMSTKSIWKYLNSVQNVKIKSKNAQKYPIIVGVTLNITKSMGFIYKIILLVPKPTRH